MAGIAIVIGINQYQFVRRLNYARDDAIRIKEFLETNGELESILLFTDDSPEIEGKSTIATRSNLLNFFHSRFVDAFLRPEDNLWFFFSGHGARTAGQDYLLPIDGLAESVADTGISVRFITERLSRSGAGNILLILDGCRDVGDGGKGLSALGEDTKNLVIENGLVSISACSPNEQSWEADELRQGIFTCAFLEALQDQNFATVRQIDNYLRRRVPELNALYRKPRQNPWLVAEPIRKADLILLPKNARERDLDKLKNLALEKEAENNFELALELWTRVNIAAQGHDDQVARALVRIGKRLTEREQREDKEQLEAQRRQKEEQERLEAQQREKERSDNERQEKKRLEHEAQSQPPSPVAPSIPLAKSEADKPSAEISKVVYPPPPKPAEPEREKPPPPSSGGTGRKSPSKQVIAVLTIAAVLAVGALIYFAFKASQSPPPQPSPIAAVTPSPPVIATPTAEEKALPRPEVAAQPSAQPAAPVAVAIPSPSTIATPTKEELARSSALDNATKEHPWVNSLGMRFVPLAGTKVLFSVWDTRVQDFKAFVKSTGYDATGGMDSIGKDGWEQLGATWKEPGFSQGPTHPVVGVNWNDAEEFCKWLTKRERSAGNLPRNREYRLPRDEEWSDAVGLKNEEGMTPEEQSGKINLYPWDIPQERDKSWPPPSGAGNYAGEEAKIGNWPAGWPVIAGYKDGYPRTSPVGSFEANFCGLYDMGGNVWQWCENWYNAQEQDHVLRGASWYDDDRDILLASYRHNRAPDCRNAYIGFRCVVAVEFPW
jgi:uncharacterized caspase-like protein/formylglycine-generating enzyme required for sulfatase activity